MEGYEEYLFPGLVESADLYEMMQRLPERQQNLAFFAAWHSFIKRGEGRRITRFITSSLDYDWDEEPMKEIDYLTCFHPSTKNIISLDTFAPEDIREDYINLQYQIVGLPERIIGSYTYQEHVSFNPGFWIAVFGEFSCFPEEHLKNPKKIAEEFEDQFIFIYFPNPIECWQFYQEIVYRCLLWNSLYRFYLTESWLNLLPLWRVDSEHYEEFIDVMETFSRQTLVVNYLEDPIPERIYLGFNYFQFFSGEPFEDLAQKPGECYIENLVKKANLAVVLRSDFKLAYFAIALGCNSVIVTTLVMFGVMSQ